MSTTIVAAGDGGGASTSSTAIVASSSHPAHDKKGLVNPSLRGIKYVIFPDNVWGQRWDVVMIVAIWYFCFYISYHLGISGGYYSVINQGKYYKLFVCCYYLLLHITLQSTSECVLTLTCLYPAPEFAEAFLIFNSVMNICFFGKVARCC